jgi:hypothetical protein
MLKVDTMKDGSVRIINVGDNFNNTDEDRSFELLTADKDEATKQYGLDQRNIIFMNHKVFWVVSNT